MSIDIQQYWYGLLLDRIHHLVEKPRKWELGGETNFAIYDVVLFRHLDAMSTKMETWKIGRIISISPNGRRLEIKYPTLGLTSLADAPTVKRSPRDCVLIAKETDLDLNSNKFLQALKEGVKLD